MAFNDVVQAAGSGTELKHFYDFQDTTVGSSNCDDKGYANANARNDGGGGLGDTAPLINQSGEGGADLAYSFPNIKDAVITTDTGVGWHKDGANIGNVSIGFIAKGSVGGRQIIAEDQAASGHGFILEWDDGGSNRVRLGSSFPSINITTVTPTDDLWHFYMFTYDNDDVGGSNVKVYKNGIDLTADSQNTSGLVLDSNTNQLCVGSRITGGGVDSNSFNGLISAFFIWTETLSQTDITNIQAARPSGTVETPKSLSSSTTPTSNLDRAVTRPRSLSSQSTPTSNLAMQVDRVRTLTSSTTPTTNLATLLIPPTLNFHSLSSSSTPTTQLSTIFIPASVAKKTLASSTTPTSSLSRVKILSSTTSLVSQSVASTAGVLDVTVLSTLSVANVKVAGVAVGSTRNGDTLSVDISASGPGIHVLTLDIDSQATRFPFIIYEADQFAVPGLISSTDIVASTAATHTNGSAEVVVPAQAGALTVYSAQMTSIEGLAYPFIALTSALEVGPDGQNFSPDVTVRLPITIPAASGLNVDELSVFTRDNDVWTESAITARTATHIEFTKTSFSPVVVGIPVPPGTPLKAMVNELNEEHVASHFPGGTHRSIYRSLFGGF